MRWNKYKREYKIGDPKSIERFLFFPRNINGETRWMEFAIILQKLNENKKWKDEAWVNNGNFWEYKKSSKIQWDKIHKVMKRPPSLENLSEELNLILEDPEKDIEKEEYSKLFNKNVETKKKNCFRSAISYLKYIIENKRKRIINERYHKSLI